MTIGQSSLMESKKEELLGITVNNRLSFQAHLDNICKQLGQRLHAGVSKYINELQLRKTMTSFAISLLSYCPFVWMC